MAARNTPRFCHLRFSFIDVDDNLACAAEIDFSLGRECKSSRGPMEEPYPKPILEPTNELGHRGRRETEHGRRARKTLVLNDPNEGPHISNGLHIRSSFSQIMFQKHRLSCFQR